MENENKYINDFINQWNTSKSQHFSHPVNQMTKGIAQIVFDVLEKSNFKVYFDNENFLVYDEQDNEYLGKFEAEDIYWKAAFSAKKLGNQSQDFEHYNEILKAFENKKLSQKDYYNILEKKLNQYYSANKFNQNNELNWNSINSTTKKWIQIKDDYYEYDETNGLLSNQSLNAVELNYGENFPEKAIEDGKLIQFDVYDYDNDVSSFLIKKYNMKDHEEIQQLMEDFRAKEQIEVKKQSFESFIQLIDSSAQDSIRQAFKNLKASPLYVYQVNDDELNILSQREEKKPYMVHTYYAENKDGGIHHGVYGITSFYNAQKVAAEKLVDLAKNDYIISKTVAGENEQSFNSLLKYDIQAIFENYNEYSNEPIELIDVKSYETTPESSSSEQIKVLVEYKGNIPEYSLFDMLHDPEGETKLTFNGCQLDLNPIKAEKSGTIEQYLDNLERLGFLAGKDNNKKALLQIVAERWNEKKQGNNHKFISVTNLQEVDSNDQQQISSLINSLFFNMANSNNIVDTDQAKAMLSMVNYDSSSFYFLYDTSKGNFVEYDTKKNAIIDIVSPKNILNYLENEIKRRVREQKQSKDSDVNILNELINSIDKQDLLFNRKENAFKIAQEKLSLEDKQYTEKQKKEIVEKYYEQIEQDWGKEKRNFNYYHELQQVIEGIDAFEKGEQSLNFIRPKAGQLRIGDQQAWDFKYATKGYIEVSSGFCTASVLERIDLMGTFESDYQASLQAEKDGIKILREGIDFKYPEQLYEYQTRNEFYYDTPENRQILKEYIEFINPQQDILSPLQVIEKEGQVNQDIGSYFKRHLLEQLKTTNNPFVAASHIVEDLKVNNTQKLEELNNYLKENGCTTKQGFETFFKDVIGLKEIKKAKEIKPKNYERDR